MLTELEGHTFEKLIKLCIEETSRKGVGNFLLTGLVEGYWSKPDGSDIEIDVVVLNEEDKIVRFGSCKPSQAQRRLARKIRRACRALSENTGRPRSGGLAPRTGLVRDVV